MSEVELLVEAGPLISSCPPSARMVPALLMIAPKVPAPEMMPLPLLVMVRLPPTFNVASCPASVITPMLLKLLLMFKVLPLATRMRDPALIPASELISSGYLELLARISELLFEIGPEIPPPPWTMPLVLLLIEEVMP